MLEPQGWIKVHRKILENPIFKKPDAFLLWMYLLLKANHAEAKIAVGNSTVLVKRGQVFTGRKSLSEQTGLSESKIERLLKFFKNEHQIEQQTFTKYRLISIVNFDTYQSTEQETDNNRTTTEQQSDTNKNDKNEKKNNKEKKIAHSKFIKPTIEEIEFYFLEKELSADESKKEAVKFFSYYDSKGWVVGKSKMSKWKSAATGWITRKSDYENAKRNESKEIDFNTTGWSAGIELPSR